jgi:hypothetical protein
MKHEYHEGPETWTRFQEGMKKLFRAPKPAPVEKKSKPKPKQGTTSKD